MHDFKTERNNSRNVSFFAFTLCEITRNEFTKYLAVHEDEKITVAKKAQTQISFPKHKSVFQNTNQLTNTQINFPKHKSISKNWTRLVMNEMAWKAEWRNRAQYGDDMESCNFISCLKVLRLLRQCTEEYYSILRSVEILRPITLKLILPRLIRPAIGMGELTVLQRWNCHIWFNLNFF